MCRSRKSCDAVDLTKAPTACGRPLGLSFDQKSGDMYYVDAIYGLQRVKSGGGGVAQPVCSSVGGSPLSFPSSVSTGGSNGELYFTDYSRKYNLKYVLIIMSYFKLTYKHYSPKYSKFTLNLAIPRIL